MHCKYSVAMEHKIIDIAVYEWKNYGSAFLQNWDILAYCTVLLWVLVSKSG